MKKLGKKFSFLTKIMLVIGLLISNLSSLSVVFAYAATNDVEITLNGNTLNISYLETLADEVEKVNVEVYENYDYYDGTSYFENAEAAEVGEKGRRSNYSLTSEEITSLGGLLVEMESILTDIVFDGDYSVKVVITDATNSVEEVVNETGETEVVNEVVSEVDTNNEVVSEVETIEEVTETVTEENTDTVVLTEGEVIAEGYYFKAVTHNSGLVVKAVDAAGVELSTLEDGTYSVLQSNSKVKFVAKVLSGGLNPTDRFMYEDEEFIAFELLNEEFSTAEMDFSGRLYGEYTVPVILSLTNSVSGEEILYEDNVSVMYESYAMNTLLLNTAAEQLGLAEVYEFSGDTQDGILYVLLNEEKINTMLDLYQLMDLTVGDDDIISYVLSNSEYENVLEAANLAMLENTELTLEQYLSAIVLDDTAKISLINDGLTVTYKVVVAADLNNDNALTEEDLLELVNQVVGSTEVNVEKSDLYELDGEVNTLDVMYLDQVMKTGNWDVVLTEKTFTDVELAEGETILDARLDVMSENIVSGDEFTVNYVLTLSEYIAAIGGVSGIFEYDKEMFELVSVSASNEWLGNYHEGKFLYLGNESLVREITENETGEEILLDEYVVVTATFLAKSAGTTGVGLISVVNPEYFDQNNYLVLDDMTISVEVAVSASDNNNLASLTVAGQTINLEEDVLEYEITVANDVTIAEVLYELENVAASVTSIVYPEELVEGANTVTITVASENGTEKTYTITVIREEAIEEETETTPVYYNNYTENNTVDDKEEVVTPQPEEEEEDDDEVVEEESNLSRIVIIILILLVIAGLVYLIFKDEDDEETKKTNKEINKLKKDEVEIIAKPSTKPSAKANTKPNNKSGNNNKNNNKNKNSKNNKKER